MEQLALALIGIALTYMIKEQNIMQEDIKKLIGDVASLQTLIHTKRKSDPR